MAFRDLRSNIDAVNTLSPAARNATANGTGVDCRGFEGAMAVVQFGTWTDGTHTPSLQESDDNSTFTAVAAVDQIGTFTAVSSAAGNNTVQRVGYSGTKRYLRVVMTVATATTGALSSATVVRGMASTNRPIP
jgi:hypothetical protein